MATMTTQKMMLFAMLFSFPVELLQLGVEGPDGLSDVTDSFTELVGGHKSSVSFRENSIKSIQGNGSPRSEPFVTLPRLLAI